MSKFRTHKELANAYGIHPQTLKKEIERLKKLKRTMKRHHYNLQELKIIFANLGNPYEE